MDVKQLRDTIWITRVSRVNAEKRLLNKDSFIQGINIYYSCVTILFSILTLFNDNDKLSLITVFMTVSLLVTILYFNSLKYTDQARDFRTNYTQLYKLELELDENDVSEERLSKIKSEYCDLLNSSFNHITYDYYCTVNSANEDFKKTRWHKIRFNYWVNLTWRIVVKIFVIILPILLYCFAGVV